MSANREALTCLPNECKECGGGCCEGRLNAMRLVSPDDIKRWLGVDELSFAVMKDAIDAGKLPIVFQQIDASMVYVDNLYTWIARMQLIGDGDRVVSEFGDYYRLDSACVMWDGDNGKCAYDWGNRPKGCRSLEWLAQKKRRSGFLASERCPWFDCTYSSVTNAREWLSYQSMLENEMKMYYRQHRRKAPC